MIVFSCEKCGKQYNLKPEFAGRKTTCAGCKGPLLVPAPDQTMAFNATPEETVAPVEQTKIAFSCTKCGMKFSVKLEFAGRTTKCPTCKESLVVPAPDQTMAYAPAMGQIKGAPSSLAKAGVDGGVTLGGEGDPGAGHSALQSLMNGKSNEGARYVVESEIARGGMGAVLRAVDCDIRREVAVKYLLDQTDTKKKLRFVEEAQITGQLEHPNIVPIHELGIDAKERIFFSMKMVKGRSLGQILTALRTEPKIAEKEYSLGKLLGIFVNICNGLGYAHSRGVVHRDLKPANIMVGDFGEVYVMDWGLAKVLKHAALSPDTGPALAVPVATLAVPVAAIADTSSPLQRASPFEFSNPLSASIPLAVPVASSGGTAFSAGSGQVITSRELDADLTQEGSVLGTPIYMPPEQAAGQIHLIDERSDIYSMGAILYEMLALQPPINKEGGYWPILMRVTQGQIDPPEMKDPKRARAGKIPAELSAVAMKALAKRPEDRYQTIEFLRKDIERFLEGRSVSAKEDTRKEMMIKFVKRNQAFSAATAAAAALLLIVITWALVANFNERRATQRAYDAYAAEQKDKEERTRRAVPALVEIARRDAEGRHFKKALDQAALALEYDPNHKDARLLLGQLLIVNKEFKDASAELGNYLAKNPKDTLTRELKQWCDKADTANPDKGALMEIGHILASQNNAGMAEGLLQHYAKSGDEFRTELLNLYRKRIETAWPGRGMALTLDKQGQFHMHAHGNELKDLAALKDIPLRTINIAGPQIRDLSALQGMPLDRVELTSNRELRDLNSLKGLSLTSFHAHDCHEFTDLSGLRGMPLTSLILTSVHRVQDVSALQGMPLATVRLVQCGSLSDLAGLKGLPITTLEIAQCPVRDLSPLTGLPLKSLDLRTCNSVRDLAPLKGLPLTMLNLTGCGIVRDLSPLAALPLVDLNLSGCTEVRDLEPLQDLPLKTLNLSNCGLLPSLKGIGRLKLTTLILSNCARIDDISLVKEMPLTSLTLSGCAALTDLSPLKGKVFTDLDLSGCVKLTDLMPLKGMPLNRLKLNECAELTDLSPLRGMPLNHVELINCARLTDLTPLKEAVLQIIALNGCAGLKNLHGLQGMRFSKLELYNCTNLESLDGLKGVSLNHIHLENCPKIANVNILKSMPITLCNLHHCVHLVDISGLSAMRSYSTISIYSCPKIQDWSALKNVAIQHLHIGNCGNFHDLSPLEGIAISSINITSCGKVVDLSPLQRIPGLTRLTLGGFSKLTDLTPLKGMKLVELGIIDCPITDLTPLKGMPLSTLNLAKCTELRDLTPLHDHKLATLIFPPTVTKGVEELREMTTLTHISGGSAEHFWGQRGPPPKKK